MPRDPAALALPAPVQSAEGRGWGGRCSRCQGPLCFLMYLQPATLREVG